MARKTFPCDIRRAFQAKEKYQKRQQLKYEVPLTAVEEVLETCELDTLRVELGDIYRDLEKVHKRAQDWLLAKLEGLTDVEIAERWGTTPQNVWRWTCAYGLTIRQVFADHLNISPNLRLAVSPTHASLQRTS